MHSTRRITWCQRDVKRLITPYRHRREVDSVLEKLGEDFQYDDVHVLHDGGSDAAVADGGDETSEASDDGEVNDAAEHALAAVAGEGAADAGSAEAEGSHVELETLSAEQADQTHRTEATITSLIATIEGLRAIGSVRGVQCIEVELAKKRRKLQTLVQESPVVADSFLRLRRAEDEDIRMKDRAGTQQLERKRDAAKVQADRDAAVAELRHTRRKITEMESVGDCRHVIKTFTLRRWAKVTTKLAVPKGNKTFRGSRPLCSQ